jgi:hypothetical protein
MGRPSKYKKEYCEMLIEHMSTGLSFESFAGIVRVNRDTVHEWAKVHQDFSEAKKIGMSLALLKWEKIGMEGMYMGSKDNPFNPTVWIFSMKNKFNWSDRKEVEINQSTVQINIDKDDVDL